MGKTKAQIYKENIFTLFNLLNFIIAVLLFAVGAYTNLFFIVIIITNIAVGITQELKAKKLVDELSILNRPQITLLRGDKEVQVQMEDVAQGDILVLESGSQVSNDAQVIQGAAEVNESLLTGESDAVQKEAGSMLLSGSFIISGKCYAKVVHTGNDNYATKLTQEVKQQKSVESELLGSMRRVTRFTSWLIVPLGILLFAEAYFMRGSALPDAVVASAAALLGMLPKGLVLLISISLANGVINLSRKKILVQNIYSLETLAHVDMLCLDKTGTLTNGRMEVKEVIPLGENKSRDAKLLAAYIEYSEDNNITMQALRAHFGVEKSSAGCESIPFSSKRKWGAVSIEPEGTVFLGAPEKLLPQYDSSVEEMLSQGLRVLAAGLYRGRWTDESALPSELEPLFFISLEDGIRKNVQETLAYFYQEGVDVKVISGDHVRTVSEVARKAGLRRWEDAVDMSTLGEIIDYADICERYAVFARVTPAQKKALVCALKQRGHHVAMTGDGVNDLLALREADCSIAVAEGSDASRQIAQIVLLESDFTHLPQVVLEGRRVINNVTRTAGVFFIKTIYSVLLTCFCLLVNLPFPFIPIQITLIDAAMEAWPSFLTILESDTRRVQGRFLQTALHNALPFALSVMVQLVFVSLFSSFTLPQTQTIMYLLLILTTMAAVIKSCIPFNRLRAFICVSMVAGTFVGLAILPSLFKLSAITGGMAATTGLVFVLGMLLLIAQLWLQNLKTV